MIGRDGYLPAGSAAVDGFDLVVTPASAGWRYSSLRIRTLGPGEFRAVDTGGEEMLVVPLAGSLVVHVSAEELDLAGRPDVFAGPTDVAYLPVRTTASIGSRDGARFALAGAQTSRELPLRRLAAADVPLEARGAGQASRLVRNLGTVGVLDAGALIVCEVVTPAGNWSSYPAHKHDEALDDVAAPESELEEIYYYEVAAGPDGQPGFGFHRTSASPRGPIDTLVEVHDRDTVLVPHGWHGPCVAAPGHDLYYLNVMAGPAAERSWRITDHPDQAWIRSTWAGQTVDPRVLAELEPPDQPEQPEQPDQPDERGDEEPS